MAAGPLGKFEQRQNMRRLNGLGTEYDGLDFRPHLFSILAKFFGQGLRNLIYYDIFKIGMV